MARPSKYSPKRAGVILGAIERGNSRRNAAALAGIAESTLHEWASEFPEFSERLMRADATAEAAQVQVLVEAAEGGCWPAALAWLERRRREEWGKAEKVQHEVTGAGGQPLIVRYEILPPAAARPEDDGPGRED